MRSACLLAMVLPILACAQSGQRGEGGGRGGAPTAAGFGGVGGPATPTSVVAPEVPVLEGLPHAIKVGYTVYVSGMVPVDSAGRLVGAGDLAAETRQAITNLGAVMRAAGGVPGDVVRATVYIRDLTPEKVTIARKALVESLDRATPPAVTIVGVSSFPEPGIDVMIEAIGELRSQFPDRTRMNPRR